MSPLAGLPVFLMGLAMIAYYGFIAFVIWKFYTVLVRMSETLEGIRRALDRPAEPRAEG